MAGSLALVGLLAIAATSTPSRAASAEAPGDRASGVPTGIAAPVVRIEPLAVLDSLPWVLAGPGAWSPRGSLLLLRSGPNRIGVFDASDPRTPPRMVHDAGQWIRSSSWSPDGTWLLLLVGDAHPRDLRMLVAVPVGGGEPETLLTRTDIRLAFWGPDAFIHYRIPHAWEELPPPARWQPANPGRPRPPLGFELGDGLALGLRRGARASESLELVCFETFRENGRQLRVIDALPDETRLLVAVSEDTSAALEVVDEHGQSLTNLRGAGIRFEPTALSGDGRLIVGHFGVGEGEQGWSRTWLEAADAAGGWCVRIAGGEGGEAPQLSRQGRFIAYRAARGVKVARLVVETR